MHWNMNFFFYWNPCLQNPDVNNISYSYFQKRTWEIKKNFTHLFINITTLFWRLCFWLLSSYRTHTHHYLDHIIEFGGKQTHKKTERKPADSAYTTERAVCVLSGERRINRPRLPPLSAGGEQSDLLFASAVVINAAALLNEPLTGCCLFPPCFYSEQTH